MRNREVVGGRAGKQNVPGGEKKVGAAMGDVCAMFNIWPTRDTNTVAKQSLWPCKPTLLIGLRARSAPPYGRLDSCTPRTLSVIRGQFSRAVGSISSMFHLLSGPDCPKYNRSLKKIKHIPERGTQI